MSCRVSFITPALALLCTTSASAGSDLDRAYRTIIGKQFIDLGHYEDQFGMYNEFGRKRIWLNAADVERTTRLREEMNY